MTENKRFTLEMQYWKGNPQGRKLFDNLTGQDEMSVEELCNIASDLHSKCEELESVLEVYEDSLNKLEDEKKRNGKIATKYFEENEQLKKDRFICLDCKYCGYTEIGCLCEKQDCWEEFKSECNDFKELKYYDGDVE